MIVRPCLILLGAAVVSWALDCSKPVGIEDGTILDSAITSNSEINRWYKASEGRLNNYKGKPSSNGVGCWCANENDNVRHRYIQFDLGTVRKIGKITTQGQNSSYAQYVTKYKVTHSIFSGTIFTGIYDIQHNEVIYDGNADQNTPVSNDLPSPGSYLEARYIRVLPQEFRGSICMRFEFYECVEAATQPPPSPTTQPPVGQTCLLYKAPENGALVCHKINSDYVCVVMCRNEFDFVFNPAMAYFCSHGEWKYYATTQYSYPRQLPWPDCSNPTNPSYLKQEEFPYFFYDGDANDSNVQAVIKTNYISFMTSSVVPPFFCLFKPTECNEDTVKVYAGTF